MLTFGSVLWIRCLLDPWIRDGQKVRIQIKEKPSGSYFLELRNHFFGLKYLNSLMRIRDPEWKKFGSGIEKSRIRDKHPGSAKTAFKISKFYR
jgi:hypothetical protein